jgi:HK97 gp10 family phage protein
MSGLYELQGFADLERRMEQFPERVERRILNRALRVSAQPIVNFTEAGAPVLTGKLKQSIRVGMSRGKLGPLARVRVGGAKRLGGVNYARYVTRGTRPHIITAKDGGALRLNNRFVEFVFHPGSKPNPFFQRGIAAGLDDAVQAFADSVKRAVELREATS